MQKQFKTLFLSVALLAGARAHALKYQDAALISGIAGLEVGLLAAANNVRWAGEARWYNSGVAWANLLEWQKWKDHAFSKNVVIGGLLAGGTAALISYFWTPDFRIRSAKWALQEADEHMLVNVVATDDQAFLQAVEDNFMTDSHALIAGFVSLRNLYARLTASIKSYEIALKDQGYDLTDLPFDEGSLLDSLVDYQSAAFTRMAIIKAVPGFADEMKAYEANMQAERQARAQQDMAIAMLLGHR